MVALSGPGGRGLTLPMDATFASAASLAWSSGMRFGQGVSRPATSPSGYRARTRSRISRTIALSSFERPSDAVATISAPTRRNLRLDAAAGRKFPNQRRSDRIARLHNVSKKAVDHVLVEDPEVAILNVYIFNAFNSRHVVSGT